MEDAAYIGTGISRTGRGANYANDIFRLRAAETKEGIAGRKGQGKLVNLDDFRLGTDNLYPLYSKKIGEVVQQAANDYVEIEKKTGDPIKARNIWEANKPKYQTQIDALRSGNESAKRVINSNPKDILYPKHGELIQAVNNPELTPEQFTSMLNDPANGSYATPGYGFNADLTPRVNLVGELKDFNKNPQLTNQTAKPIKGLNGMYNLESSFEPSNEDIAAATRNILQDPVKLKNYVAEHRGSAQYQNPDFNSPDDTKRLAAQQAEVGAFVKQMMRGKTTEVKTGEYHPPQPTQKEKDKNWITEGNTIRNGKNVISLSQISETDIPNIVGLPGLKDNPNLKVLTYSHTDAAENKPLLFVDLKGNPVTATFRGGIVDTKNPANDKIVVEAKNDAGENKFVVLPNTATNRDVIKNEFGKGFNEVIGELGGKSGTVKEEVAVSTKKSSGSKTIKRGDIAAKAAASGYSSDEYEKLLKQNGIIIQ